jgi:hypothetical protein
MGESQWYVRDSANVNDGTGEGSGGDDSRKAILIRLDEWFHGTRHDP